MRMGGGDDGDTHDYTFPPRSTDASITCCCQLFCIVQRTSVFNSNGNGSVRRHKVMDVARPTTTVKMIGQPPIDTVF